MYDAVDALEALGEALELEDLRLVAGPAPGFDPAQSAEITVDGEAVGHVGVLAAAVAEAFGVPAGAVAFELDIDGLLGGKRRDRAFRPLSRFPASNIDLAFVLDDAVPAADVERTLRGDAGRRRSKRCACFDEFRSESLGPRRRRAWPSRSGCGPSDRTLTDSRDRASSAKPRSMRSSRPMGPSCAVDGLSAPFVHRIRPRYAEVDQQGVVFNAHWLTYFDDACTRFFEWLGWDAERSVLR